MAKSEWDCLVCGKPIEEVGGVSLDASTELHVCGTCYKKLTPEARIAECRAWRESSAKRHCLLAFEKLCRAAMGSTALSFLGRTDDRGGGGRMN